MEPPVNVTKNLSVDCGHTTEEEDTINTTTTTAATTTTTTATTDTSVVFVSCRVSPKTLLTFCTNGVLLRTLMGGSGPLNSITHIIVVSIVCLSPLSPTLLWSV